MENKGFTLIEFIIVIAIITIFSGIILLGVSQYIKKGKDSNIFASLAVLIPAGEVYYNGLPGAFGDGSTNFCNSSVATNLFSQMPNPPEVRCGVDSEDYQTWAVCVKEFVNPQNAYCVDNNGTKKDILNSLCINGITQCP